MSFTGPRLYLASGVTSVRTTGSVSPYADINLKKSIDAGRDAGAAHPRHVAVPHRRRRRRRDVRHRRAGSGARRSSTYWADEGATWVKFYADISRASMKAAIDEAHRLGIKTTGHLCSVTFREAVGLGIDDLAHGAFTATDFVPSKEPDKCPPDSLQAARFAGHRRRTGRDEPHRPDGEEAVSMTTTMAVIEAFYPRPAGHRRAHPRPDDAGGPDCLPGPAGLHRYHEELAASPPGGFARALAFDKAFFAAGGVLGSGVDPTGNGGALPGFGDQRGYELLSRGRAARRSRRCRW